MEQKFERFCPSCSKKIEYTNKKNRNQAEYKSKRCRSCVSKEVSNRKEFKEKNAALLRYYAKLPRKKAMPPFVRKCPKCNKELNYTSVKNRNKAEKRHLMCLSCARIESELCPKLKKRRSEISKKRVGSKNSFYGKHHTEETKEKLRKVDRSYTQTKEFRKKSARHGFQNGMYGKTFYDVWKEKYGKEEADTRYAEWIKKQSKKSSGKNNPMYGKPAPRGSGGGWSGWYKGWYFRSLRELTHMIDVIEAKNYEWESAESKRFSIPYVDYNGNQRTYRPDFLINKKILIEVKPKQLMETPTNLLKKGAAIAFCDANNLEYRMVDIKILDQKKIIKLFKNGDVVFNKKYQKRMNTICESAKNKKSQ